MILSYKDQRVERLYQGEDIKAWSPIRRQAEKRLRILDSADRLKTLMILPSNRLEALRGDRPRECSIRINDRWRICFIWPVEADGPGDVEIVDYH